MKRFGFAAGLAAFVAMVLVGAPVRGNFHEWEIQEVYTNFDGSIQFIELFCATVGQQVLLNHQITANSDGNVVTFTFNANSGTPTTSKHLLIATPGFGALTGGVAPNYTLPDPGTPPTLAPFFRPDATSITINFVGADSVTFSGASLPADGVNSLNFTVAGVASVAPNSPRNFANATGSVNLPPPPTTTGDYNGDLTVDAADYTTWRDRLGQAAVPNGSGADGDADGTIDDGDYDFWKLHFGEVIGGAGSGGIAAAAVPEPAAVALAISGILALIFAAIRVRPVRVRL